MWKLVEVGETVSRRKRGDVPQRAVSNQSAVFTGFHHPIRRSPKPLFAYVSSIPSRNAHNRIHSFQLLSWYSVNSILLIVIVAHKTGHRDKYFAQHRQKRDDGMRLVRGGSEGSVIFRFSTIPKEGSNLACAFLRTPSLIF